MNNKNKITSIKNRIDILKSRVGVDNGNIIRKLERQLKNLQK